MENDHLAYVRILILFINSSKKYMDGENNTQGTDMNTDAPAQADEQQATPAEGGEQAPAEGGESAGM